jgi:methionyl-tRNA synthetase
LGKHIVVVTNLEPAVLRGVKSDGMLLAGDDGAGKVGLVLADFAKPGERVLPDGFDANPAKINIKEFAKVKLSVVDGKVLADGNVLKVSGKDVNIERVMNGSVR